MKKALKELVENAEVKMVGEFRAFLTIPNGIYDGFWGKNGYDNILLLGYSSEDGKWYRIADTIDAIHLSYPPSLNWEISSKYGVPCFWSNTPISIEYDGSTSSLIACERRADVVERKKGKWIPYEFGSERWHKCSACGKADEYINERGLEAVRKFCPNCGAKMCERRE